MNIDFVYDISAVEKAAMEAEKLLRNGSLLLLISCAAISLAVEYAAGAGPGRNTNANPVRVLYRLLGLGVVFFARGYIYEAITGTADMLFEVFGADAPMKTFLEAHGGVLLTTKTNGSLASKITEAAKLAGAIVNVLGSVSGAVGFISTALVSWVANGLEVVGAVLIGMLIAIGPLAIAASMLPGGESLLGTWIRYLCEISSWKIFLALDFKFISALTKQMLHSSGMNWWTLFEINLTIVATVAIIPTIATRLVGGGFGKLAPSVSALHDAAISKLPGGSLAPSIGGNK